VMNRSFTKTGPASANGRNTDVFPRDCVGGPPSEGGRASVKGQIGSLLRGDQKVARTLPSCESGEESC